MRYDLPPQLIMTYCERVGVLPSVVCRLANRSPFIIIRAWIGLGQFIAVATLDGPTWKRRWATCVALEQVSRRRRQISKAIGIKLSG